MIYVNNEDWSDGADAHAGLILPWMDVREGTFSDVTVHKIALHIELCIFATGVFL